MTSEPFQQTGLARQDASRQTPLGRELGEVDLADTKVLPIRGGRAARARGAILRRLLAISDWISLVAGTALSYLLIASVEPSSIAWSAAFGPAWILVMKLHGLYDQDHRRIRHSTLDELPALFSATVIGTVVVGVLIRVTPAPYVKGTALGVLAVTAFVIGASLRGLTRQIWHARRPPEKSAVVGSGAAMRRLSRRIETHPEVHLSLDGYFGDERTSNTDAKVNGANGHMRCLGPRSELISVAEQRGLEHILIAEESISTGELRRLIGELQAIRALAHPRCPQRRAARAGNTAQSPGRAPAAGLRLLRSAAIDDGAEAGDRHRRLRRDAPPAGAAASGRGRCDQA